MSTKIQKLKEEIAGLTLLEAAELLKSLENELGISAAAPVAAAAAPAAVAAAPAEEKTEFKVTLKDSGANKINVIKALRTVTTLGLKEAKDIVEGAPATIAESASKDDAKKIKETLEAAGAKVELS